MTHQSTTFINASSASMAHFLRPFLSVQLPLAILRGLAIYKWRLIHCYFHHIALIFEFLRTKMAHGGILVFSLPLLVVLMHGLSPFPCRGRRYVRRKQPPIHPSPSLYMLGIIYCMSCRLPGYDASPLPGAVARLQCSSSAPGRVTVKGTTDENGYFLIQTNKVTNYGAHKCRVFLVSSPLSYCNVPFYPAGKRSGSRLIKVREEQKAGFWPTSTLHCGGFCICSGQRKLLSLRDLSSDLEIGCYADREISKNNSVLDIYMNKSSIYM